MSPRAKRPSELLGPIEYVRKLDAQRGACAIRGCGNTPKTRRLDIDHNHRTGQTRGLLCSRCNRALPGEELLPKGMSLGAWLFAALEYVAGYET
jgi:hypothetical protein